MKQSQGESIEGGTEEGPIRASGRLTHWRLMPPVPVVAIVLVVLVALGVGLVTAFGPIGNNGKSGSSTAAAGNLSSSAEPKVGSLAPDFSLVDVRSGQLLTLSSLRGKPVWINFWATWCPTCKTELPVMKELYARYRDEGLEIVGIDMREDPPFVKSFIESNGYGWRFVVDTDGAVTNRYYVAGIPSHLFVDAKGVIRAIRVGDLQKADMNDLLGEIVSK